MTTNRCYILGAGFSKPFGLPLACELTSQVFNYSFTNPPNDFDPLEIVKKEREFIHSIYPLCDLETKWPDFEDLITVLDDWEDYRIACQQGTDLFVSHLKKLLMMKLPRLLCVKTEEALSNNKLQPIKEFLKRARDEKSCIISFNWDLLLEIAAKNIGLAITYQRPIDDKILVAKPHGSINLAELKKQKYEQMKKSINVHSLDIEWERSDNLVVRAQDPCDARNRIVSPFESFLLVEPTIKKSYISEWISLQWHIASDMVTKSAEIVIIGYSMPCTDIGPRLILQLSGFNKDRKIALKIIDPNAKILKENFCQFIDASVTTIEGPWEEMISNL